MKYLIIILLIFLPLKLTAPADMKIPVIKEGGQFDRYTLSWASVDYWLGFYEVKEKDIVKAQIRLETGNLQSRYCLECNNLTGMKKPRKRETTAIGRDKSMSVYSHFSESIRDYRIWQDKFYRGGDYYEFLVKQKYAQDKQYIEKLKKLNN